MLLAVGSTSGGWNLPEPHKTMMDRHNTATVGDLLTGCCSLVRRSSTTGAWAHQLRSRRLVIGDEPAGKR
jgi:hypothetical protein